MKQYFSFDRFVKYLKYDIVNAKSNYGLSALIIGLLPVSVFLAVNIFSLVFIGRWSDGSLAIPIVAFSCTVLVTIFTAGVKLYGNLTEKKDGSNWLLIPASTLEKTLSMILITCILIPVFIGILLVISDVLLQYIPGYGESVTASIKEMLSKGKEAGISFNAVGFAWVQWSCSILFFTLGAVFFKKAKAAKTFLAAMIISSVIGGLFGSLTIDNFDLLDNIVESFTAGNSHEIQSRINWAINIQNALTLLILGGGLYWRLKTLKH